MAKLSKVARCKNIIRKNEGKTSKAIIGIIRRQLGMSHLGARSYYYTNKNNL